MAKPVSYRHPIPPCIDCKERAQHAQKRCGRCYTRANAERARAAQKRYRDSLSLEAKDRRAGKKRQNTQEREAREPGYQARKSRENRQRNPATTRAATYRWVKDPVNQARVRAIKVKRRAAHHSGGTFSAAEWEAVLTFYGHRCRQCATTENLTVDHAIPLCRGGTNTVKNLQPLCKSCNSRKHGNLWPHLA